ncbi:MAG TPA: mechanosensitive ion channel domain-containing protein [Rariglobus sp.]|jgi:small-conductance mechanosensitive channel|nr:mechanosensitive ion channel domain-containing protein [Rariglobus sp.]
MKFPVLRVGFFAVMLMGVVGLLRADTGLPPLLSGTVMQADVTGDSAAGDDDGPSLFSVFNRPIVLLRAELFGSNPGERTRRATQRIDSIMDRNIFGPVSTEQGKDGIMITVAGELVITIAPGDADALAGKSYGETAAEAARLLAHALTQAKAQDGLGYLAHAILRAGIAVLLYVVLVIVVVRLNRFMRHRVLLFERQLTEKLKKRGLQIMSYMVKTLRWTLRIVFWLIVGTAGFECLAFCLGCFPYTKPWGDGLQANLWDLVLRVGGALVQAVPNLLVIALILLITRGVIGLVRAFFRSVATGHIQIPGMEAEAARATQRIIVVVVWLFAVVMIYPYIPGSSSAAFKGMSVFIGLLVSLGSSSVIGQFTSGLVLMYSRALKPGEYVRIGDYEGVVETLGFLSTKIRSNKNEELHVPNAVILGTTVKNFSRFAGDGGVLVYTSVTIGYDTPWRQVHAMLAEAAGGTEGLSAEPKPFVQQTALSDFYVEYQINARLIEPSQRNRVLAALHANIQDVFNSYGVQIMSPHYIEDKDQPAIVPKEKWFTPPATPGVSG